MNPHVVKYDYEDGEKLRLPILWCGAKHDGASFLILSAEAALNCLDKGTATQPCRRCVLAMRRLIDEKLGLKKVGD